MKQNIITSGGQINRPAGNNTIILSQAMRWHMDIAHYIRAVTEAERVDYPNRARLQDLYTVALTDAHLFSVLEKRKAGVLSTLIEFSRNGRPDQKINELIESPWFHGFLSDLLDAPWMGPSLFQFHTDSDGWMSYDLIPRKNVDPVGKQILRFQSDIQGLPWSDYTNLLFVGNPRDNGHLIKAIPWVLYKNGTTADWAQFAELFGQPIREYTYDSADDRERQRLLNDAYEQGGSSVYIHPASTTLRLLEAGGKTGSAELYSQLVDTCNAELSKLVLGNTLTTEATDKGTQALGTVHQKVEDKFTYEDKLFVLHVLNYQMTDIFEAFGYNTKGGRFTFVTPQNTDLSQRIRIDRELAEKGLPISDDYWYETYGIPKPENYDELKAKRQQPDEIIDVEKKGTADSGEEPRNLFRRFFDFAPPEGASEW